MPNTELNNAVECIDGYPRLARNFSFGKIAARGKSMRTTGANERSMRGVTGGGGVARTRARFTVLIIRELRRWIDVALPTLSLLPPLSLSLSRRVFPVK